MPRPAPHSFARQLGLQAIMWGLLAAALVGAWQLSRDRDQLVQIPPLAAPVPIGALLVSAPRGWLVQLDKANLLYTAIESTDSRIHRVLIVAQQQVENSPDDQTLSDELHRAGQTMPIDFKGLAATGLYAQGIFQDERTGVPWQGFVAAADLPNGITVTVEMRGVPGLGAIDLANFQAIINGLKPAPSSDPNPLRPGTPLPIIDWH